MNKLEKLKHQYAAELHKGEIIDKVIMAVCSVFRVTDAELKSDTRVREISNARSAFFHIMAKHYQKDYNFSLTEIGAVCNRDHATVLHSKTKVLDYIATEPAYRQKIEATEAALGVSILPLTAEQAKAAYDILVDIEISLRTWMKAAAGNPFISIAHRYIVQIINDRNNLQTKKS